MSNDQECLCCESPSASVVDVEATGEIEGETLTYEAPQWSCSSCGNTWLTGREMVEHDKALADAYRAKHGLMLGKEIEEIPAWFGMSPEQLLGGTDIGVEAYYRWLKGGIQDREWDRAVQEFKKEWRGFMSALANVQVDALVRAAHREVI